MESQQLSQNSPNSQFDNCWDSIVDKGYKIRYTEYTRNSPRGYRNPKMESIFLYTNITIIPHSVLYVSLSYYIINPCTSASSNFDDSFS
jgi:hypothetical protein